MGFISVVSLLSHILISISITTAQMCYDTGNFTPNSTYAKNRNLILSSLSSNITTNGGFYINATIGQYPNKVYAHAVCSGDISPTVCSSCLESRNEELISMCPVQKEAFSWEQGSCMVHYADHSFFGVLELNPSRAGPIVGEISWDAGQFYQIWSSLMDRVVKKASLGSSWLKFATGEANLTYFQTIYTQMQCTPDISQSDCDDCLRQNVALYERCCRGRPGGYAMSPNCVLRWALYRFYQTMSDSDATVPPSPLPLPSPPPPIKGGIGTWIIVVITVSAFLVVVLLGYSILYMWRKHKGDKEKQEISQETQLIRMRESIIGYDYSNENLQERQVKSEEFPHVQLSLILQATQDFSNENKLGEGGFGPVYKGTLVHGKEIAVKRLSRTSEQGLQEFKNEITLIAKLQHKNLVRLLGCCLEGNELLLIYEYMPNKSLDVLLFDSSRSAQLDWKRRLNIINGIVRGVLYLHEDSRLKIIHRDLKASNVLLDHEMNAKISDFGLARIFGGNQTEANTNKVVGTYGYMAPEYAKEGLFSVKSDVFSFGVLLLEIISGKKNNRFHNLLDFAWKLWCEGQALELIDPVIVESFVAAEVSKCIHVGLLCVQEDPADRPTMSLVVVMLGSETLPQPTQPGFSVGRVVANQAESSSNIKVCSINELTLSNMSPR